MRSRHITKILDRTDFNSISAVDSAEIGEHIKDCRNCRAAFHSARISSILLKEKFLAEPPAPSPFFQAKVLEAWREKQAFKKPIDVFRRWWQASAALVFLMFLTVIGLIAITLATPNSDTALQSKRNSEMDLYSAESVILNQKTPRNLTTEQLYEALENKK